MSRVRNAVAIIILCIIGMYSYNSRRKAQLLDLPMPAPEVLRDAVAGGPTHTSRRLPPPAPSSDDQLRDSLAANPGAETGRPDNGPHGNTQDQTPPPPRGGDHHLSALSGPNPGS